MSNRFHALLAFAFMALAVTLAAPSQAQTPELAPPGAEPPQPVEPPPDTAAAAARRSDAKSRSAVRSVAGRADRESAKFIEGRIWAAWAAQGGDTATLLMSRVRTATEGKDFDLAIKLLTAIIDIKPDYIEAWNRRATLYFHKRDYVSAMSDLRSVLTREPRHFGAWAGLGMILQRRRRRAACAGGVPPRGRALSAHGADPRPDQAADRDASTAAICSRARGYRYKSRPASAPTNAIRSMLVAPGVPSGTPATTITRCPARAKPSLNASRQARSTMSS